MSASPALAAPGDGPYTPFPEDPAARALDFLQRLNSAGPDASANLTPKQLERGVVVRPPAAAETGARPRRGAGVAEAAVTPFRQAGVARASDPPSPAGWPFAVLAGVLASAAVALALRGRAWSARQRN